MSFTRSKKFPRWTPLNLGNKNHGKNEIRLFSRSEQGIHQRISSLVCWLVICPCGKNSQWTVTRRTWLTWLWFLTFNVLLPSASAISETSADCCGAWFRGHTKKICLITRDVTTMQVKFSLRNFFDFPTHLLTALLLIIIQQPWLRGVSSWCNG